MNVKLDWQIEAERESQRASEDPAAQHQRRRQRWRVILITLFVVALVGGGASAIGLRLYTVDTTLRSGLIDAAMAETLALRLGDENAFMVIMRSNSQEWKNEQRARFQRYQDLKAKAAIQFTGDISEATVDGNRGRVQIAEIVNGVRNVAIWFFWRYADGWRHVPSDLTFWGDPETITGSATTITYNTVDSALASSLAKDVERWWGGGCALVGCTDPPHLTIAIVPDPSLTPQWSDTDLTLRIGSPLASGDRAPVDPPVPDDLETAIANQLADKLFDLASGRLAVSPDTDAFWLRQAIVDWTAASLLGHGSTARIGFVQSIADHNGGAAVSKLIHQLSPNSDIAVLATTFNTPLETLPVDWSSFFQWRLVLEKTFISARNQPGFNALWDQTVAASTALKRWSNAGASLPQVQTVTLGQDAARGVVAVVATLVDNKPAQAQFRIVDGTWKRIG